MKEYFFNRSYSAETVASRGETFSEDYLSKEKPDIG
jgi:hypothetical protein